MSSDEAVKECPECGAVMSFEGFVNKKKKRHEKSYFVGDQTFFALKSSGSYRCPNGHKEIKE